MEEEKDLGVLIHRTLIVFGGSALSAVAVKKADQMAGHIHRTVTHKRVHTVVGEGGHVRIAKVQHALTKVLLEIGCLYLAIIMSSYSRFIVPVKKLQLPP